MIHLHHPASEHGPYGIPAVDPSVVLIGNPNVGKSALFGALTGTYAHTREGTRLARRSSSRTSSSPTCAKLSYHSPTA